MKFTSGGPCDHCDRTSSPCWRKGPPEKPTLCNACGSRFLVKKSLDGYMPQAFPAGGAVQALQREAQQRQQQRALQYLDLPSDGRARQKRTQLPSSQQRAKQRKRDLGSYADQISGGGQSTLDQGEPVLHKRPRTASHKAEHRLPQRPSTDTESPGRHSVSGCNTQYLPQQSRPLNDALAGPASASATLLRYFSHGKTTVDVATQTSNSWIDDGEDEGQEEVEGAPDLVVTGLGIESLKFQRAGAGERQSPLPRSSSGSGERSSGAAPLATTTKARRRRKPAHPVSSKLY
ncbi:hypothetical protein WJX84_003415 [Apatococcus fuscideae]|uniref:GATA-type domain-containing protein n=1 Tax=Apatococcus fuscideae TaxID=2026836 RepID=A0AAW1SWL5_9CHLO